MFCSNCGQQIDDKAVICPKCGVATANFHKQAHSDKDWLVALLLCFFFGALGFHRFYVGKVGTGILMLILTITLIGALISIIWSFIDLIMILTKNFRAADGTLVE